MISVKIWNDQPSDRQVEEIAQILEEGRLAIMPTDTMYAIVCNALDIKAVEKLCKLKHINPEKTNLSILCSNISMAAEYARIDNSGYRILKEQTPGPVTVLFPTVSKLPRAFRSRKAVGIRIPDSVTARKVVERIGSPLLTTTIEYSEEDYAVNPDLIAEAYDGKVDLMIDGGDGNLQESSIIDCTGSDPVIIRE